MNVLLLSVKAGYGHHSTAQAIINIFEEKGHNCAMLDIFSYINKHLGNTIQDGYILSTKYLSKTYGKVYNKLNQEEEPYEKISVTALISNMLSKKLIGYVQNFNPDLIISTHSYAALLSSILKEKQIISCPLIGVVTDFTVHPFWENTPNLDYYVIPDSLLTYQMQKKGIPPHKLLPTGIPIKKCFSSKSPRSEAIRILGLKDKRTILVMMGSMGYGNIKDTLCQIDEFDEDFQVIVVCGSNKKLKSFIDNSVWHKSFTAYGFVNNVALLMDASDIIITKPGGLTTSEAMAKRLPLITMNPIPGQEDKNQAFLVNSGVAIAVDNQYTLSEALYQFFHCSWRRNLMTESVNHLGKPNAAEDLYNFVVGNLFEEYSAANNQYVTNI